MLITFKVFLIVAMVLSLIFSFDGRPGSKQLALRGLAICVTSIVTFAALIMWT